MPSIYLFLHLCFGILIVATEYLDRRMLQTYQIFIRTCPQMFSIEFRRMNYVHSLNWLEEKIRDVLEMFHTTHDRCTPVKLQWNIQPVFVYLRYLWLAISGFYSIRAMKRAMRSKSSDRLPSEGLI